MLWMRQRLFEPGERRVLESGGLPARLYPSVLFFSRAVEWRNVSLYSPAPSPVPDVVLLP